MEAFKTAIWIVNVFSALAIIVLVLMQHGKGAEAGASFGGSGSAQGVFGSGGNANFLSRMTSISAIIFFASCLALGYVHSQSARKGMDFSGIEQSQTTHMPAQSHGVQAASAVAPNHSSIIVASQPAVNTNANGAGQLSNEAQAASTTSHQ